MSQPKRRGIYVNTYRDPRGRVWRADLRMNADDVGGGFSVRGTADMQREHPAEALARASSVAERMLLDPAVHSSLPANSKAKVTALRLLAQAAKNGTIDRLVNVPSLAPAMRRLAHHLARQGAGKEHAIMGGPLCVCGADDDGDMGPAPFEPYQQGPYWNPPSGDGGGYAPPQQPAYAPPSQQPAYDPSAQQQPSAPTRRQPTSAWRNTNASDEARNLARGQALSAFKPTGGWSGKPSSDHRSKTSGVDREGKKIMSGWFSSLKKAIRRADKFMQTNEAKAIAGNLPYGATLVYALHTAASMQDDGVHPVAIQAALTKHLKDTPSGPQIAAMAAKAVADKQAVVGAGKGAGFVWPGGTGRGTWADHYWETQRRKAR